MYWTHVYALALKIYDSILHNSLYSRANEVITTLASKMIQITRIRTLLEEVVMLSSFVVVFNVLLCVLSLITSASSFYSLM